ncbi:MAG: terminase large subunit [Bacteroidales bacterium]|nr:terminase large subunit [Bacteroidales bacterium]
MRDPVILRHDDLSGIERTYLWQYRESIRTGETVAGQELIMELDRLLDELQSDEYFYDTTEADERIDFMQNCIRLTKSPFYGKPMILMLWQKAFIETIFSYKMTDTGFDRFQRILLVIGRKNTKSETSSAIMDTELIIGGEGKDLVCSSNDDNQADILYQACDTMRLMIDPESLDTWKNQKWIKCLTNDNKIFKLSDRTRNKEGRNIDFAVVDEVHEMKDNVIIKSIEQSQSLKENPKLILITTEGFVNDGFLDNELIRDRAIIRGEITDMQSKRVTAWLYTQDSETEVWNGNRTNRLWMKSNPTLGTVKQWSYLEQQVDLAKSSKADRAFVLSKDFNIKQSNSEAWLMLEDYDYVSEFDPNDFRGALVLGAVDIAETTDLSCAKILLMKPNDSRKYVLAKYFIPEGKLDKSDDRSAGAKYLEWANRGFVKICPGNYIDVSIVADWFYEMYKEYGFRPYKVGYDVRFATDFLKRMDMYGFDCEMVYQRPEILNQPIKMVEADLKSQLIIGSTELDKWCYGNTALKIDNQGNGLLVKIDGQVSRKIDGSVTLAILYEIFRRYRTEFTDNLEV